MRGFLGTAAIFSTNFNLVIQIAVALTGGILLARRKKFSAQSFTQTVVLIILVAGAK